MALVREPIVAAVLPLASDLRAPAAGLLCQGLVRTRSLTGQPTGNLALAVPVRTDQGCARLPLSKTADHVLVPR
jgi:hypothetical protein